MAEFDYSEAISEARAKYESISKALDVDRLTAEAKDLEVKAAEPGLWDDPENAQKVTSKLSAVQSQLKRLASADQRIEDVETLVELGQEEEDADTLAEAKAGISSFQSLMHPQQQDWYQAGLTLLSHTRQKHKMFLNQWLYTCGLAVDGTMENLLSLWAVNEHNKQQSCKTYP